MTSAEHPDDPRLTAHVLGEPGEGGDAGKTPGPEAEQAIEQTRRACLILQEALACEAGEGLGAQRRQRLQEAMGEGRRWLIRPRALAGAAAVVLVASVAVLAVRLGQVAGQRDELARAADRHARESRAVDEQLMAAARRVGELQKDRNSIHDKLVLLRNALTELRAIAKNPRQVPADLAFYKAMSDSANYLVGANNDEQLEQAADNTLLALTALDANRRSYAPEQFRRRLGEANGRIDVINAKRNEQRNGGNFRVIGPPATQPAVSPLAAYAQSLIAQGRYAKAIEVLGKELEQAPAGGK